MNASPECVEVIKFFEYCKLRAYPDPKTRGDPWTIGWGATGEGIGPGVVWTQAQADARLEEDISTRVDAANAALQVEVTQGQFDAFVSALFNIGAGSPRKDGIIRLRSGAPSTFLRLTNAGRFDEARQALGKWVSPGSNVERGLRRRRTAEQALWDGKTAAEAIRSVMWPLKNQ
jgi:lysozyme